MGVWLVLARRCWVRLVRVAPGSGNSKVRAPREHFYGIYWEEERYDTGYFLGDNVDTPWVVNPRKDNLARMPWSNDFKAELNRAFADVEEYYTGDDLDRWLDSMSYKQLLEDVMGLSSKVTDYFDPILAISMGGVGADAYSAYSAKLLEMPGTNIHYKFEHDPETSHSFPGGNTGLIRHIVKYLIDDSIESGNSFEEILVNPIRFDSLDRSSNRVRIRLNATAIDFSHAGRERVMKLISKILLVLFAPQLALGQWTDGQEGQLVIRGGWLFDSVSDERRPNTGIVIQDGKIPTRYCRA